MIKHHIKVAVRNIRKQGIYAFLNFLGLAVALVLGLFVLLLIRHELSFDSSFKDNDRIYRMATEGILGVNVINSATTPMSFGAMLSDNDDVEDVVRLVPGANNVVSYGDINYNENGFLFADANFFDLFDLNVNGGDNDLLLDESRKVVITKSTANKYFGDENPIGKEIVREKLSYTVSGVCEDMPSSTHFDFGFVASIKTIDEILLGKGDSAFVKSWKEDWLYLNCYTYLKLKEGVERSVFVKEVNEDKDVLMNPQIEKIMKAEKASDKIELSFFAQNIRSIHFTSHLDGELKSNSNKVYIILFAFIAIFVMLTTCVNFVNLTTAKMKGRYKDVGYRQLVGATRFQLMAQFMVEAIVYSFGAMFIGMVLLELLLPFFNSFFEVGLDFNFFKGWVDFFGILLLLLFVGFLLGSFPAFFFSGKKPEKLITGEYNIGNTGFVIRGLLTASQFAVAMFLVVVASAMWWQLSFVEDSNHGFVSNNIICIERGHAVKNDFGLFKEELLDIDGVKTVTACNSLPGDDFFQGTFRVQDNGDDKVVMLPINYIEDDYFRLLDLKLTAGRFLEKELGDTLGVVINAEAVKQLNFKKPLDRKIEIFGNHKWALNTVGVVKDFHYNSYFSEHGPLALILLSDKMRFEYVLIELEEGVKVGEEISQIWDQHSSSAPFVWEKLDERFKGLYEEDRRIAKIMTVFAILSLFIAFLGVIALVAFILEYKTRAISIKKLLGVPYQSLIIQVFSSFSAYVILGVVIAIVPAYFAIVAWGASYAYLNFIGWPVFAVAAFALILLSVIAAFFQIFKSAFVLPIRN